MAGIAILHFIGGWLIQLSLAFLALYTQERGLVPLLAYFMRGVWTCVWFPGSMATGVELELLLPLQLMDSAFFALVLRKLIDIFQSERSAS